MAIFLKRAYEEVQEDDGFRILVDRLWPRGLSKDVAKIDLWMKEIAPSTTLRKWFAHDPLKWDKFKESYIKELDNNANTVNEFLNLVKQHDKITLIYGAKDTKHSQAKILKEYIEQKLLKNIP